MCPWAKDSIEFIAFVRTADQNDSREATSLELVGRSKGKIQKKKSTYDVCAETDTL